MGDVKLRTIQILPKFRDGLLPHTHNLIETAHRLNKRPNMKFFPNYQVAHIACAVKISS